MSRHQISLKHNLLPVAILLLAFALRLAAIDQIPAGLSHDEAYNGVTAIQVLEGQRRIFFEINKGIEPLIIYLEALAFYAFGIGPVPLRLVNVFCGLLTVALVYPLAMRLFNRRVALLAMAGLAISFWPIFVSRLTLRAVTFPPLLILTLLFLWRGLTSNPSSGTKAKANTFTTMALSGLAAGVAMYTYLSSRFVPVLVLAIFGYQLVRRHIKAQHWLGLLAHFFIWATIFSPLANYYLQNLDSFTQRYNQVTTIPYALNGEFGPLAKNTGRTLGMFTFRGDTTDRYNLDGRPIFDWFNGTLFYLGLGLGLLQLSRTPLKAGETALVLLWLFFMLLPDFTTDDSPHFLRTIGAMPAVYILWAQGLDWASRQLNEWQSLSASRERTASPYISRLPRRVLGFTQHAAPFIPRATVLILILLMLTTLHTMYDYFGRWASSTEARYIYGADIAEVARYVKATKDEGLVAISAEYFRDLDPFRFNLHFAGQPPFVIWFDGRQTLAFPPPDSGLSPRYIFPTSAPPADTWLPLLQLSPSESGREFSLYRLPAHKPQDRSALTPNPLQLRVHDDLILSGYEFLDSVSSGGQFHVLLEWQPLRALPPGTDYTFLVRMWDRQGHVWAEDDGNGYSPVDWQPGVQALQLLTLRLPGDLSPRTYKLTAEIVDRHQGRALPTAAGETIIPLATIHGRLADTPQVMDPARLPNPVDKILSAIAGPVESSGLALRGYRVSQHFAQPDDTLTLTLHWQVLEQPLQDYWLTFFLADDQPGQSLRPVYQWPDIEPLDGEWPTGQWPPGYWVQDKLDLSITPDIPSGKFKLWLALTNSEPEQSALFASHELASTSVELGSVIIGTE